ncbi:carbohydrate ABC transporter permease [Lachnotalea sp. AF33-28]|uniref:carbohydrate ABC transporter permease n=1 Tax=Lachnotalea sp. AF33-28 TaxID=2292046 RepID=UPI000E4892DE|nr:carbohydrate ABC transporter permease [Lachnotalea sp. AF33-28]RHP35701.1 carbohydrate ABC transporter permease [Lachnotalea sp. AF33-28]
MKGKLKKKACKPFDYFLMIIMLLVCFITLYPMWYIVANSLAAADSASLGATAWWPSSVSFDSYKVVFQNEYIVSGFLVTIARTVIATAAHVIFTAVVAYGLSRPQLVGRKLYMKIAMITMFFNGGLIPNFILMLKLHLYNTFWVFVIPGMFTFYDMIIFISFFRTIPDSLLESAKIDGASEYKIFWKILLPNCKAVIATIVLFAGVYHWNDYYQGIIYIRNKSLQPLQTILYKLLAESSMTTQQQQAMLALGGSTPSVTIKFASMVVATLPIICIYPFIQKYLVKGVMIGAIKG